MLLFHPLPHFLHLFALILAFLYLLLHCSELMAHDNGLIGSKSHIILITLIS